MTRRLVNIGILLLTATFGCVYYGLDVEGKSCNTTLRRCPPGYRCEESSGADGGMVCKLGSIDGGNCTEDESRCDDFSTLVICRSGDWRHEECGSGKYCFAADGVTAAITPKQALRDPNWGPEAVRDLCAPGGW